jgi:DNA polymerase I-like protein with 3'-5' exonuclease and polymerase domains
VTILIPTQHLESVLHKGMHITDAIYMDLAKADRVSREGFRQVEHLCICHPSNPDGIERSVRIAKAWMQAWRAKRCMVAVDTETSGLNFMRCQLYSIAVAGVDGFDTAVAFTLKNLHTLPWPAERALIEDLHPLLADPLVPKCYQNAPYDRAVLAVADLPCWGTTTDTMSLYGLIQADSPHKDLGWIGHQFLDVEPWKQDLNGDARAFVKDHGELLVYNAKDALNTGKLVEPLTREVTERGNAHLIPFVSGLSDLATEMELYGLPIGFEARRRTGHQLLDDIRKKTAWLQQELAWPDFNPLSQAHRAEVYYGKNRLGLLATGFTKKTHAPSTSYKNTTIIDNLENPIVRAIVDVQEFSARFAGMYGEAGAVYGKGIKDSAYTRAIADDGRLHAKWNPNGTPSFRYSSSPNVQNPTKVDRGMFVAPSGRVFVAADKDQLELRIAACLAGVRELLVEMAREGGDPHRLAAIAVWGAQFLEKLPTDQKKLRDAVKNVVYAALYMAGVTTVYHTVREKKFIDSAMRASLDKLTVAKIMKNYFGKYWEFKAYHDQKYAKVCATGKLVVPPFGCIDYWPVNPPSYTEVANRDIQKAGAMVVGWQMLHIREALRKIPDAFVVLHGHDEVVVECREMDAERVRDIVDGEFGHFLLEGPAGSVDLSAKAEIGKNLRVFKDPKYKG